MKNKIAVIGSGISGLSIASILNETNEVRVFERKSTIGGLVHCDRAQDVLYHRVGGHVFNSKNKEILDWFWTKFNKETEFVQAKRNAKIFFENRFIGYPIENFLYQLDADIVEKVMAELVDINKVGAKDPMAYDNFETFLQNTFGSTLYKLYFKPYNNKIWKTDLSKVSMQWLEGKLPMPRLLEIISANIIRKEEGEMVHANFYYPKSGGSQFIAERLAYGLSVTCNSSLEEIFIDNRSVKIFGESFNHIIYTGDIRKLPDLLTISSDKSFKYNDQIKQLRSNGTSSVLCSCDANDLSWLYIPEPKFKAHRIIYTGNFSPTNNSDLLIESHRSSCTVEFSGICTYEEMLLELKMLPGNLTPIDYNNEPNSYVIQDHETRKIIQAYKEYLKPYGIHLLGRFAEWEYYNMDKAMEAAFGLKEQILAANKKVF
ncbi:protoporphyrinogen/coproporphyrinogen oxidase [Cytophaga aurantiaca]|uniref:protoporphyrinogen/coproporphyrinogen oxidase n=1 Tax=Cytophaga aurantiaca TaxID=29530 RepID=UPI0003699438|nr:NAD(P)-binding protein [Cytophaga aurantiaca]